MLNTYRSNGRLVASTPWERRLASMVGIKTPTYFKHCPGGSLEADITVCRGDVEIELSVTGSYCAAENGGRSSPSYDACIEDVCGYYYREGKGWVEVELSDSEVSSAEDALMEGVKNSYDGPDYDDPPVYEGNIDIYGRY